MTTRRAADAREGAGVSSAAVAERLDAVRVKIANRGRDPAAVRIVAVTKGFGPGAVSAAIAAGLGDVGENYAQELLSKAATAPDHARWHYLGQIQRNKVARLAAVVSVWHGVDREGEGKAIASAEPGVEAMVQVNVTGSSSRPGCRPSEVDDLVARCRQLPLDVSGLMAVGPEGDPDGTRSCFRWLAGKASQLGLRELSMGMSDDFEVAVEEGATTLRLGRTLFGPRPRPAAVRR
ncbi:MAG TPA: YggS family pyridoxal phosphate enzyme [Acidimicrobiales bacterium]|nr:YggS family pyridoxal phosphate enzyme [Acidimicrobiales bacterium]